MKEQLADKSRRRHCATHYEPRWGHIVNAHLIAAASIAPSSRQQQQQQQRHHLSLRHSLPFELPLRRFHFRHRQRHCAVPLLLLLLLLLSIGNSHTVEKRERERTPPVVYWHTRAPPFRETIEHRWNGSVMAPVCCCCIWTVESQVSKKKKKNKF